MKKSVLFLAAFLTLGSVGYAHAQTSATPAVAPAAPAKSATPQQNKMSACSKQYRDQKIPKAQHQAFMSQCLKKQPAASTTTPASPAATAPATTTTKP